MVTSFYVLRSYCKNYEKIENYEKDEAKEKNRLAHLGKKGPNCGKSWFTNGEVNVMASECPDGFWKGMTRR